MRKWIGDLPVIETTREEKWKDCIYEIAFISRVDTGVDYLLGHWFVNITGARVTSTPGAPHRTAPHRSAPHRVLFSSASVSAADGI